MAEIIDEAAVEILPDLGRFIPMLRRDLARVQQALNNQMQNVSRSITRQANAAHQQVRRVNDQVQRQTQVATRSMARTVESGLSNVRARAFVASRAIGSSIIGGISFAARGIAAAGVLAAGAAATIGIKTAASLEQAQIAFGELLGGAKEAQKFLGNLSAFAAKTPFELPGLINSARQLLGAGQAAKDVIPIMTALGDATGALGLGQESFNRIMLAVTQSMNKGKIQAEELMQITEAGLPIYPLLAKALHMSVPELQDLASKGKLMSDEVLPKLFTQLHKDYGGAMAKQSMTLTGLWSTFMDTINIGLATTLQPLIPFLKNALAGAIKSLSGVFEALPKVVTGVRDVLVGFVRFLSQNVLPTVKDFGSNLIDALIPIDAIKAAFDNVIDFIAGFLPTVKQQVKPVHVGRLLEWPEPEKLVGMDKIRAGFKVIKQFVTDFFKGFRGEFKPIRIGRMIEFQEPSEAGKLGQSVRDTLSQGIGNAIMSLDFANIGRGLAELLFNAIKSMARFATRIAGAFVDFLGSIDWFKVGTDTAKFAITFAAGFIIGFINNVLDPSLWIDVIGKHWQEIILAVITVAFTPGKILGGISKALARIPFVGRMLAWLFDAFVSISKGAVGAVGRFLGRLFEAFSVGLLGKGRVGLIKDIVAWLQLIPQRIREFIPVVQTWARRMIERLGGAIENAAEFVGRAIRRIILTITAPFRNAATWLIQRGQQVISGLIRGVLNMLSSIGNAVGRIVSSIRNKFTNARTWLLSAGRRVIAGLWDGLKQVWEDVKKWFLAIPNWIKEHKGPLSLDRKLLVGAGTAIMGGFLRGLKSGGAAALSYVKGIVGDVSAITSMLFGEGVTGTRTFARGVVQLGQALASQLYGWTGGQWSALFQLWQNESGWNPLADNPTSTAFGIPQFIAGTASAYGVLGDTNPLHQIVAGLRYIRDTYGTPMRAWAAWLNRNPHWYGRGGWIEEQIMGIGKSGRVYGFGESGRERVTPAGAESETTVALVLDLSGADEDMKRLFRKWVRVDPGRGNVRVRVA